MKYIVQVVDKKTGEVVKRIDCGESERKAYKTELRLCIHLNIADFYTEIVEVK